MAGLCDAELCADRSTKCLPEPTACFLTTTRLCKDKKRAAIYCDDSYDNLSAVAPGNNPRYKKGQPTSGTTGPLTGNILPRNLRMRNFIPAHCCSSCLLLASQRPGFCHVVLVRLVLASFGLLPYLSCP